MTYHGPLLVVMPDGYGGYQPGGASATVSRTLAHLAAPGTKLGDGAITRRPARWPRRPATRCRFPPRRLGPAPVRPTRWRGSSSRSGPS